MPLVPCITNSGPGAPLYAAAGSGGGGGGGGPNLVVSTIQSQIVGQEDVIFIGANGNIIFDQPAGANAIQFDGTSNGEIRNRGGVFKIGGYPGQPEIPVSISTLVVSTINGAAPGGGGVGPDPVFSTLTTQLDATIGGSVICGGITINGPGATTTTLAVNASNLLSVANGVNTASIAGCGQIANGPNPVSISSLSVSSINGAAPSGGGVDPAGISTGQVAAVGNALNLRVGSTEGITLDGISNILTLTAGTGTGKVQFSAYSTIIGFDLNVSSINGAAPGGGGAGPDLALSTLTMGIPGGISGVSSIGGVGGSLPIVGGISVSSISVSSINGGAYPPAGAALQFSSIGVPGGGGLSSFTCDPGFNNPLVEFSTITGHTYSATAFARAQTTEIGATGDQLVWEFLSGGQAQPLGSWPNESISTTTGGGGLQYICGTANWKAAGTGTVFNVFPAQSSFVRVDGINVIDFGAI